MKKGNELVMNTLKAKKGKKTLMAQPSPLIPEDQLMFNLIEKFSKIFANEILQRNFRVI